MFFGDRVPEQALVPHENATPLLDDNGTYEAVLDLAIRIGVAIVPGTA